MDPSEEVPIPQQQRSSVIVSRNHSLYPPPNHPPPNHTLYSATFRSKTSHSPTFRNKQSSNTNSSSDLSINGHFYSPQNVDSPSDLTTNGHYYSPRSSEAVLGLKPFSRQCVDTLEGPNRYNGRDDDHYEYDGRDESYDGRRDNYDERDEQDSRDESSSWISNGSWGESPAPHNSTGYPSDVSRSPAAHNSSSYPSDVSTWDLERSTFLPSTSSRAFQKDSPQFIDKRDSPQFIEKREAEFTVPVPPKKRVLYGEEPRAGTFKTGRWNESSYVKVVHPSKLEYLKPADMAQVVKKEPPIDKPESHQALYSQVTTSHRHREDPLNIDSKSSPAFANLSLQGYSHAGPCTSNNQIKIEVEESSITEITTVDETLPENEVNADEAKEDKRPVADCHVCGDKAIAHMHYGGICCYSCKAFFRRAVQSGKDAKYTCKKNNECQITVASRRSCQKCRFVRCVDIGMIPNWVLSDEQCQIRFGNRGKEGGKETEKGGSTGVNETRVMSICNNEPTMVFTQEEELRMKFLLKMYEASNETINYSEKNPAVWQKVFRPSSSSSSSSDNLTGADLTNLVQTVIQKIMFLIQKNNKYFQDLHPEDQGKLLRKNMNEICLYHGAIRFNVNTKKFEWNISTKDKLARASLSPTPIVKKPVISKNSLSNLYESGSGMADYVVRTIEQFARLHIPTEVYLLLIHICAFSSDGLVLHDRQTVERTQYHYLLDLHRYLIFKLGNGPAAIKFGQVMSAMASLRECSDKSENVQLNYTSTASEQGLNEKN